MDKGLSRIASTEDYCDFFYAGSFDNPFDLTFAGELKQNALKL